MKALATGLQSHGHIATAQCNMRRAYLWDHTFVEAYLAGVGGSASLACNERECVHASKEAVQFRRTLHDLCRKSSWLLEKCKQ